MSDEAKTPVQTRNEFLDYLLKTYSPEDCATIFCTADKLLALVTRPFMLNAFALANAELAALYFENKNELP